MMLTGGRGLSEVLTFVMNAGKCAAEDQLGLPFFQISMANFKHLSDFGHLCNPKAKVAQQEPNKAIGIAGSC